MNKKFTFTFEQNTRLIKDENKKDGVNVTEITVSLDNIPSKLEAEDMIHLLQCINHPNI